MMLRTKRLIKINYKKEAENRNDERKKDVAYFYGTFLPKTIIYKHVFMKNSNKNWKTLFFQTNAISCKLLDFDSTKVLDANQ